MEEKGVNPTEIDELIARFQGGDESVFSALCDRYAPMLSARVRSYFGNCFKEAELDFDEMMQDAKCALFRAIRGYNLQNGSVSFGLYARACVNNALASYCRSHKRVVPFESIEEIDETLFATNSNPLDTIIAEEKLADLYVRIGKILSPLERKVFDLFIEGERTENIAKKLGKDEKSVSNALYRMLKKLREAL